MRLLLIGWLGLAHIASGTPYIELYRVQHRPASELVTVAQAALGGQGVVTLDARTATLILNGTPAGIQRALALLERLDQPLRSVVLKHQLRTASDLDALDVGITWKASLGPLHIGTLPIAGNALAVSLGARRTSERVTAGSTLRLLEGSAGVIATGTALPLLFQPYWGTVATEFVSVETGFEAKATVFGPSGDEKVRLELTPFAGRVGDRGEIQYIAAATTLEVRPGETVVLGETSSASDADEADLHGVGTESSREQQILLISVEITQ